MFSSRALKFAAMLLLTIVTGLTTRACRGQTTPAITPPGKLSNSE